MINKEVRNEFAFSFLSYLTDIEWQFDYETIVIYIEIYMR